MSDIDPNDQDPIEPQSIAVKHSLRTKTGDGHDLYVESGYVLINGTMLHGNADGTWKRKKLTFPVGPLWGTVDVVPVVSMTSIMNKNAAVNAGWAVDQCDVIDTFSPGQQHRQESLSCHVAVRDADGFMFRVNYQVTMVGDLA